MHREDVRCGSVKRVAFLPSPRERVPGQKCNTYVRASWTGRLQPSVEDQVALHAEQQ